MSKKVRITLLFTSAILFFLSIFLYFWENKDSIEQKRKQAILEEKAVEIIDGKDNTQGENAEENKEKTLIIDWKYLKLINEDIIGWIYIPNTNVNYPLLKGPDNQFYERKMFDKSNSIFGSIFMDYRNTVIGNEQNTIIYGHNTFNHTMFADIPKYTNKSFMDSHPTIFIYTPTKNYEADIFLAYVQDYDDKAYQINVDDINIYLKESGSRKNKLEYASKIEDGSINIEKKDRIITLSTCSFIRTYNDPTERVIVQAKLR